MKKTIIAALLVSAPAAAADFDIAVENFTVDRGIAEVVMKVTNNTGRDAEDVFIDCAFLDEDKRAIDIGKALISYITAGDYVYEEARIARGDGVEYVECRVTKAR